jgi:hypothetical protein
VADTRSVEASSYHTEMEAAANCDVCDQRPGIRSITAYGIETWACVACLGEDEPQSDDEVAK